MLLPVGVIAVGLIAYYIYRPCAVLGLARSVHRSQLTPTLEKRKLTQRTPPVPIMSSSAGLATEDGYEGVCGTLARIKEERRNKKIRRNERKRNEKK